MAIHVIPEQMTMLIQNIWSKRSIAYSSNSNTYSSTNSKWDESCIYKQLWECFIHQRRPI